MKPLTRNILVITDDQALFAEVHATLAGDYRLIQMEGAPAPDLIVIDSAALSQPAQQNGLSVFGGAPVLVLVHGETDLQEVAPVLAERATDFLVRPFVDAELRLRVERSLQRAADSATEITAGDLWIDCRNGEAYLGERPLSLTRKEFTLLCALAQRSGRTVTRDELLNEVWGFEYDGTSNALDVHIRSLRRKLEPVPARPQYITTVRGIGYRLH